MRVRTIPVREAIGLPLSHDLTQIDAVSGYKGARFKRGHVVCDDDIPVLLSMGREHLSILELGDSEVRARVATHLELRRLRRELDRTIRAHEERMNVMAREIADAGRTMIRALAGLAAFRDDDSGANRNRTREFRRILSEEISGPE